MKSNKILDVLFGVAVGDALGVPVEFKLRTHLRNYPLTDMTGYGTYNMPIGTFSDDSSLTFCLAEALTMPFALENVANNFVKWRYEKFWTARNLVFDIGIATNKAIENIKKGIAPTLAGGNDEMSNGNGSLMRILPIIFHEPKRNCFDKYEVIADVSAITHRHDLSKLACIYYCEFAYRLMKGQKLADVYTQMQTDFPKFCKEKDFGTKELPKFKRLLLGNIFEMEEKDIHSTGYVIHSLEASIWCLFKTNSYAEATLLAANLGEDSDTTAAITGGLAGLIYGYQSIPEKWLILLARNEDIKDLGERMAKFL